MEQHVISCITKWWCGHKFILFSLEFLWTSYIKIGHFLHFSDEERLSSSMVVGSLSYYPPLCPFYYHGNRCYLQYFIKVHTFIIHGNRSASPWSSKFQKNWRWNPCSPLPAHVLAFPQGWPTLLSSLLKQPRFSSLMIRRNQDGRWCYEKRPVPNAKWWILRIYSSQLHRKHLVSVYQPKFQCIQLLNHL
jgi:hypothetical protein